MDGRPFQLIESPPMGDGAWAASTAGHDILADVAAAVPGVLYRYEIRADGSRRYTYVSDGVRELLGLEPAAVMADGMSLYKLVPPEQAQRMYAEGAAALREGRASRHDVEMRLPDGQTRHVQIRASASFGPDGARVWTGLITDVSSERRIAAALARSEERAQLALETVADGLWDWNVQTGDLYIAPHNLAMLGYGPDKAITRIEHWRELYHPDDWQDAERRWLDHFAGRTPVYEFERRLRHADGSYRWVLVRGRVVQRGPGSEPIRMVGTNVDVTAQRELDRELRMFKFLSDHASDAHYLAEAQTGRIRYVNAAACALTGYTREQMLALTVPEVNPLFDLDRFRTLASELAAEEKLPPFESVHQRRDGELMPVELNVTRLTVGGEVCVFAAVRDLTARKRAEEALRRSEERFRSTYEHAPVGIMVMGPDAGIVSANPAMCAITGYSEPELIALGIDGLTHPDDQDINKAPRADLLAGRVERALYEKRYIHKSGRVIRALVAASAVRDDRGQLVHFLGQVVDVSALRQAEEGLRASEARFRAAFDCASAGLALLTPEARFVQVNAALCDMLGYPESELVGLSVADVTHPDDLATSVSLRQAVYEGRSRMFRVEKRYLRKDGRVVWGDLSAAAIRDTSGQVTAFIGQVTDITSRKHAEEGLRASEVRFRAAFENAPVGVVIADPSFRVQRVNPAFCRMTGYSEQELVGLGLRAITHPEDLAVSAAPLLDLATGASEAIRFEERYIHRSGQQVWTLSHVAAVRDQAGRLVNFIGMVHDITDQKRSEEALRASVERFQALAELTPVGTFQTDAAGAWLYVGPRWVELAGISAQEATGFGWISALHPDDRERVRTEWNDATSRGGEYAGECRFLTPQGKTSWIYAAARPLRNDRGAVVGYLGAVTDVTGLKEVQAQLLRALRQREDLLRREASLRRELDHRVRNNLAALQGLIGIYERRSGLDGAVAEAVRGKILAMREVHDMISRSPGNPVLLSELARRMAAQMLAPAHMARISLDGPEVHVAPTQAGALAIIIQELLTNARKHGALKAPGGAISLRWDVIERAAGDTVRLMWAETGGAPALRPEKNGVGLGLIEGFAAAELRGEVDFEFGPDGFRCILSIRLAGQAERVGVTAVGARGTPGGT